MCAMKEKNVAAVALGRLGGKIGGPARARRLTEAQRSEIARHAALSRWEAAQNKGKHMYTWTKTLTASEAIQPNLGAPMPFIRCTQSGQNINHAIWFRDTFFASAGWHNNVGQAETIHVPFEVTIGGQYLGQQYLDVDYDPQRSINHGAPTVHIIYNSNVDTILRTANMTGHTLTMTSHNGMYTLSIK